MSWQLPMMIVSKVVNQIKELIQLAKQLDAAAVDLQIVTGKSREEVDQLMLSYSGLAKQLGATTQEVAQAANMWMRQGYDVAETNKLVQSSMALSKLGMIEAGEATKYLTSMLKGFNLEASDSMDIVSKLTKVDMHYAASAGGIAEALSQTAVSARLAGVNIDNIVGYATEIIETSQASPSRVGNALKTMFSRYGNVKAGVFTKMSLLGEEGDTSTTENINDIEKVLRKLGISIRSSSLEMRPFEDVIAEVAEKWKTLNSVSKNAVATALGGTRQREFVNILLENYSTAEEISEMSRTSSGTAETKYEAYLDSVEAAQKRLVSSWEGFIQKLDSSGLLKILYNLASAIIDYAPSIIRVLTMKFVGDRVFGQTGSIPAVNSLGNIISRIRLTPNGEGSFILSVAPSGGGPVSPILGPDGRPAQPSAIAKRSGAAFSRGRGAAVSAGLGLIVGLSEGLLGSGSNRDKGIKGATIGASTAIFGALGAAATMSPTGAMIGAQAGSVLGEWFSDLFITELDKDAKKRDEAIQKASDAIVQAIDTNDSIERISELASGAVLSAEDYAELRHEVTDVGSALLASYEGQQRWMELTGHALDENSDAITDLNNTLVSGSFLEKWKAIMALQIINTENTIAKQVENKELIREQLEYKSRAPGFWDYTIFGKDQLMMNPDVIKEGTEAAIRAYYDAGGTGSFAYSTQSGFPQSALPYEIATNLVRQGIMKSTLYDFKTADGTSTLQLYKPGGNFTAEFLQQGAPRYQIEEQVRKALQANGADPFSTEGKELTKSLTDLFMSGASEGLQDWTSYNELIKEIRGSNIQLAYKNMAFALDDETLHSLTLNQIIGRIASTLASVEGNDQIYDSDGTIKQSIKTDITNYLKTVDALNSRFNDTSGSFASLASKWKLLNEQAKNSPDLNEDLKALEQTIISTANAWGFYVESADEAIKKMAEMPEYMSMITTEDAFRSTADTASRLGVVDDMLDKLYNRQGLSAEDITSLSTQFAQAGITGDLSNRNSAINSLMKLRDMYTKLYIGKYAQDQLDSPYVFSAVMNTMSKKFSGFDQVLDIWQKQGITSFTQLNSAGYAATELADQLSITDYTQTDWYHYLQNYLNSMAIEIESVAKRVQAARKVLEYDLSLEIDNLTAQKTALEDINNQREYELTLIKAKQKLEDARNQKQRVWREGVGWVYEANQEAIANAQKELEDIENRKTLSEIEAQIKELQYSKDMISKVASAKEVADLRNEYNAFIDATETANSALLKLQKAWEGKMSLGNIFDQVSEMNKIQLASAASKAELAYNTYVNGNYDNTIEGQRKKKADYEAYQKAQGVLINLVQGNAEAEKTYGTKAYYLGQDAKGNGLIAPTFDYTFKVGDNTYKIQGWDGADMGAPNYDNTVLKFLGLKKPTDFYGDVTLENALMWANKQNSPIYSLNGSEYTVLDGHFYRVTKAASGHLSFPGGPVQINEQGTEGIITPQGTLTALPSGTGIVPADITKNVWALGEVAPNLLRSLASLEAKGIINNNNSSTTEDSLIINSLMIKMNADKDFNIDKFVKELKNAADLSRHY